MPTWGHIQHMYSWWWVSLSPETCRVKPLRRNNAIVASCWTYFTTIFLGTLGRIQQFITIPSLLHFYYQLSPIQTTYMNPYISMSKNYSKLSVLPWLSSQYSTFSLTGCVQWMTATWNRQVIHTFKFCASALFCMSEVITLFSRTFIFSTHIIGTYLKYTPVQISWCQ